MSDHRARFQASRPESLETLAFAVWAFALAVATCLHEWQRVAAPLSSATLPVVLAIGVLLKPSSVPRLMALLAGLATEMVIDLPDVFNHVIIAGLMSFTILVWWLVALVRAAGVARDPGFVYRSIGPFLRPAFILVMYAAAFSKLNTGFLDPATTCAVWILDRLPLVGIPQSLALLVIVGGILTEFGIPTLLIWRRTRILAVAIGVGFGIITALAGHAPFAGFGWTFYLMFVPPGTLGRSCVIARHRAARLVRLPDREVLGSAAAWIGAAAAALIVMAIMHVASGPIIDILRGRGTSFALCVWIGGWSILLLINARHWLGSPQRRRTDDGRSVGRLIFMGALVVLVLNASSPYLGLKTRYSFTMFSNLQTEPGRWNHLIVPEAVRVFALQDGLVRFGDISDPDLAATVSAYSGSTRWSAGAETSPSAWVVLAAAQRIVANYPDAVVHYEYAGETRVAQPVSADPIIGASVGPIVQKLGGFRPIDAEDTCQL